VIIVFTFQSLHVRGSEHLGHQCRGHAGTGRIKTNKQKNLYSLKCEIIDRLGFHDFDTRKSFWVGGIETRI
jgi:hypothetical protein